MNEETNETTNRLEQLLDTFEDSDSDPEGFAEFLAAFATEPLTLAVSPPWESGGEPPPLGHTLLIVSDGDNVEQPMLAVFTRPSYAEKFCREFIQDGQFEPYQAFNSAWAILQTPEGAGIRLNPNLPHGFRMTPQLVEQLKRDVQAAWQRARKNA
ncbi:MAG: SseB family protein [Gammaproteobacteria bacterium]